MKEIDALGQCDARPLEAFAIEKGPQRYAVSGAERETSARKHACVGAKHAVDLFHVHGGGILAQIAKGRARFERKIHAPRLEVRLRDFFSALDPARQAARSCMVDRAG